MITTASGTGRRVTKVKNGNMNGIQFYLTPGSLSGPLVRGHYLLVESSWAITALSQDSRWWKAGPRRRAAFCR